MTTNYNNYYNYGQQVSFASGNVFNFQEHPACDSTSFSENQNIPQPKKEESFLKKYWGGLLLGTSAIIAGILIFKGKTKNIQKLTEKFKPAQNIDEAKTFAKQTFNVEEFDVDDLEVANWINEGLLNVKEYSKGKSVMPKKVAYVDKIRSDAGDRKGAASYDKGLLKISKENWQDATELVRTKGFKNYSEFLKKHPIGISKSPFSTIYHEIGHANHELSKNCEKMMPLADAKALGITDVSITEEFLKDTESLKKIKSALREYSMLSPAEFVADTFDMLVAGRKVSNDIMQLYKKYEGPTF